ncbi:MAG TPA: uracil-DNA glycosylase family protein [Acidimicrobiales bacterium]|nr:uracil-DNA glycosylase family protein [Acidimicrobiales bacterium]
MDRRTVEAYEGADAAQRYIDRRAAYEPERAVAFASRVEGWRADIGSGPGHYTTHLGAPLVSLDASAAMLARVTSGARVQADLEALPLRRGALRGAWASKCYQHIPHEALPLALADLHRSMALDAPLVLNVFTGEGTRITDGEDDFPGRLFSWWQPHDLARVVEGAGFVIDETVVHGRHVEVLATRARMLPDLVRPGLRVLFCGYNPSIYAADVGVAFARPGNRFWPAALAAGIVSVDRDPWHAVRHHRVGFTDMVKRASVAAAELSRDELHEGFERVTRLCEWLHPEVVCVLGVGGWRQLVNRKAIVGWQPETLGGSRVYVMPNPSGLNASTQHEGYVEHLTRVSGF